MGWAECALAFAALFLIHSVPIRPRVWPWLVTRLGQAGSGLASCALSPGVRSGRPDP
jgi:hypothetical protein